MNEKLHEANLDAVLDMEDLRLGVGELLQYAIAMFTEDEQLALIALLKQHLREQQASSPHSERRS